MTGSNYWEYYYETEFNCDACGWRGSGPDASHESFSELFELWCPNCDCDSDRKLAVISHPTHRETRNAAAAGNKWAIAELPALEAREAFINRGLATELKQATQLPDIAAERIDLTWKLEKRVGDGDQMVEISHGDQLIWREVAYWDDQERFVEILRLAIERYSQRLHSFDPKGRDTLLYLGGDHFGPAFRTARRIRLPVEPVPSQQPQEQSPDTKPVDRLARFLGSHGWVVPDEVIENRVGGQAKVNTWRIRWLWHPDGSVELRDSTIGWVKVWIYSDGVLTMEDQDTAFRDPESGDIRPDLFHAYRREVEARDMEGDWRYPGRLGSGAVVWRLDGGPWQTGTVRGREVDDERFVPRGMWWALQYVWD